MPKATVFPVPIDLRLADDVHAFEDKGYRCSWIGLSSAEPHRIQGLLHHLDRCNFSNLVSCMYSP